MYKLIVIDDEIEQVDGITSLIDWEKYDITVCAKAYDGNAGLEKIIKHNPDIAIVDIRMPFLNGLQLIEEVKKRGLSCKTIVLSGYDDFIYAQNALKFGSSDYLLKPCKPEEILQSVLKVKDKIEKEKNQESLFNHYQNFLDHNLGSLRNEFLSKLIKGKLTDKDEITKNLQDYKIDFKGNFFNVAVLKYNCKDFPKDKPNNFRELSSTIIDIINQTLSPAYYLETIELDDHIAILISGENSIDLDVFLPTCLDVIYDEIIKFHNIQCVIGVGIVANNILSISQPYKQALTTAESNFFLGKTKVIIFEESTNESYQFLYPFKQEEKIFNCLERGNQDKIKTWIENFYNSIDPHSINSKEYIQKYSITLLSNTFRFCMKNNINIQAFCDVFQYFDHIFEAENMMEIQKQIIQILSSIIKEIKKHSTKNIFVSQAIEYIHAYYNENVSLNIIAEDVGISTSYLSLLFKQEMGINFIDYLNRYRIEKAKEYLTDCRYKNYEVAYKVGYQDDKYFYQIFKRYTGLTATQYREKYI